MMQFRRTLNSTRLLKQLLAQSVAPAVLTAALCAAPAAYAQQTTSSITGQVTDSSGVAAAGTKVVVTHVPSGTTSSTTVDSAGRFNASSLRVGGPYVVRFDPPAGQPEVVNDVFLQLGQPFALNITLKPVAVGGAGDAQEIVVSGQREELKLAAQATFSRDYIENSPSVSRDLKDIIKQDPRVLIDPTNSNAIQIAGTSPRFNSLTIDGVKVNDDFGLNNNGYPTHHSPIPLDAVDQLAVVIAPFDVDYDGFQGGTINVVTKSGTNDFHGSAYYFYSGSSLSGTKTGSYKNVIPDFQTRTRGGSIGGPIVPDKLFFFGSFEDYTTSAPATYGTTDGAGGATAVPGVTSADIAKVTSIAQSKYGYNTGSVVSSTPEHDRTGVFKADWNITDEHRATFTYEHSETTQVLDGTSSSAGTLDLLTPTASITSTPHLALSSNFYNFNQVMNNYTLQLFSDWTSDFSTQLQIGRKNVDSNRVPLNGYSIGEVRVLTPEGGEVVFGPDISSQSNVLSTTTDAYKAKAKYTLADHTFTAGYEREVNDYYDLFIQRSLGQFYFSTFANFQAGTAARFQYANAYTGNPNDNAAIWDYAENSFYLQDRWDIAEDLTIQGGLRYERYQSSQSPLLNTTFESRYGFANNGNLDGRELLLPRLGFNYKVLPQTTLRGGVGEFSTLGPAVWMSNDYNNDGFTQRSVTATSGTLLNTTNLMVPAAAQAQLTPNSGYVNALDPHFSIPSSLRTDIALDHNFENGLTVSGEFIYTKVLNGINYQDLRLAQTGTAPDGRPIYGIRAGDTRAANGGQDLLLTNTHQGESKVGSLSVQKAWDTDIGQFQLNGGYAWTQATDVNPGTSSVASSTYNNVAVSDPNHPGAANSNYTAEHTFTTAVTWTEKFFGDEKTSLTLLGTLRSGLPYSYVFACGSGAGNMFGDSACTTSAGVGRELFYVPTGPNDPHVNWAASTITAAQMAAYVDHYGLNGYKGQIAPRNAFNAPWFNTLDMHFLQELPSPVEGHKFQLTVDTVNFSNLLFPGWGRLEQVAFPGNVQVAGAKIVNNQYVFTSPSLTTPNQSLSARASVWQVQLGLHYSF